MFELAIFIAIVLAFASASLFATQKVLDILAGKFLEAV